MPVVLAALALSFVFGAVPAQAVLITVNFTVRPASTDLSSPPIGSGSFSFDDSLIPPGGGDVFGFVPIDSASFTWAGVTWTPSNSRVDVLQFNASGDLIGFRYHGGSAPGLSGNSDFLVRAYVDGTSEFAYRQEGILRIGSVASWSTDQGAAPEPATSLLLLGGLIGVMTASRRVK
ncbi:MAG TPA: PEP-CTERM sorting domain-containing protein [Candidatus Eisenbacteria bacterium]|nr:PEP-CTERM sorting domain-containing protein [Candidatus Eisenbacteria bacterium]